MRSFALAALIGALAQALDGALVLIAALLVLSLCVISHWRDRSSDPGITTELALFVSFLLGVNAIANPEVSAGAAVIIAAMLNLRGPLHRFARVSLKTGELRDGLILAGAALVVLPLLPDTPGAGLLGANPRRLVGLMILMMSVQAAGYIALRIAGPRLGLALSGFASGFVSSTATTVAMGSRARRDRALIGVCVSGALVSNIATFILLLIIAATIAPNQLEHLATSLGGGLLGAIVVSGVSLWAQRGKAPYVPAAGHAFSIQQAMVFALILSAATIVVAYANAHLGQAAVKIGAALAGLADVHAAAGSIMSLASSGALKPSDALFGVLLALSANTFSKMVAAGIAGGVHFASRVGLGLGPILLAAWTPYWLSSIQN